MKKKKSIPNFKSEEKEREFWRTHDSSDYVDWKDAAEIILSKLKPSTKTISLRLPEAMIDELKILANKNDIPYQSLLKVFIAERLNREHAAIKVH